jgi:L-proline amide hydrolase
MKSKWLLAWVPVICLSSCASAASINRAEHPKSICEMRILELGGERQYVLIRGEDRDNPVVLFIHGGPGNSEMPLMRMAAKNLEDQYTIVLWDQRGSGKSYRLLKDRSKVTRSNIESDCVELIDYLRNEFHQEKIYLIGHSWGTVVGIDVIKSNPEKIAGYIGIGQIVDFARQETISYQYTQDRAKEQRNAADIRTLERIGAPVNGLYRDRVAALYTQRKLLLKYGGSLYGRTNYSDGYKAALSSHEYNLLDLIRYDAGSKLSLTNIWNEDLAKLDYFVDAPKLAVPVSFFVGRQDYQTSFMLVEAYYNAVEAPRKRLVWFEKSAHSPLYEEIDKFDDEVRDCFR